MVVNTFVPFIDYAQSAKCLDRARLCSQRNECKVIIHALLLPEESAGGGATPAFGTDQASNGGIREKTTAALAPSSTIAVRPDPQHSRKPAPAPAPLPFLNRRPSYVRYCSFATQHALAMKKRREKLATWNGPFLPFLHT